MSKHDLRDLQIAAIHVTDQVRKQFDDEAERRMSETMLSVGVEQPIRVRATGDGKFTVIFGERRLRAAKRAGLATIPAIIDSCELTDADILERLLIENIHRLDLNPIEKALGIASMIKASGHSAAQVAKLLGIDPSTVSRLLALLTLPETVQAAIRDGKVGLSLAYEAAVERNPEKRAELCERLLCSVDGSSEGEKLTREQIQQTRRNAFSATPIDSPSSVTLQVDAAYQVRVAGPGLTDVQVVIKVLQATAARLRKSKALTPATAARLMKEEARSTQRIGSA